MDQILKISQKEKSQLFQEAAARSKEIKSPIIIEKDFWVCWALQQIFNIPEISPYITFKGGTSLSKCYNIINRFSEDCDLTINKEFLGFTEVIFSQGRKQKDKSIKKLVEAVRNIIIEQIKPLLIKKFQTMLSTYFNDNEWQIINDPNDEQSLLFYYPTALPNNSNEYVRSVVKLEFGARGDNYPNESKTISPYIYAILTNIFDKIPLISVHTLTAKRTFWEKITLLHAEYHRKSDKPLQNRIFRHYYDIVMLDKHGITIHALDDMELLNAVLMNKKTYFSSSVASYETAKIGTIRLLPNNIVMDMLKHDCKKMSDMFFGESPNFNEIMTQIERIENTINSTKI